ncbi:MAG: CDP-diacylglycerol--serine O-phosphatidyltransferase [Deltaproteobacteria bacterium]|nr:MAG: CDP-diacylglycerol--serine O-phosphatidyltransferase [Deltaproteobacteria bacterium]
MRIPERRYILPNLFTLGATFCGFTVIWMSHQAATAREFYLAATLLPLAVLLDGFDGRVARMVGGESRFGVQMDSLSDFLAFGVAPAVLVYCWALHALGFAGLLLAFLFAAGAMIRLARFNVQAEEDGGSSAYFTGLPAPMAGVSLGGLVALDTGLLGREAVSPEALLPISLFVVIMAFLMVSEVPFRTYKDLRLTAGVRLVLATVVTAVVLIAAVADFMFALSLALFLYVLGGVYRSLRLRRKRIRLARRAGPVDDDDEHELEEDLARLFDVEVDPEPEQGRIETP